MLLNKETDFSKTEVIKIGILSDTHNELSEEVSLLIKDCDIAIHAGDIGCSAVLEGLQPKSGHVIAVSGNNDKPYLWDVKDWAVVKNLPEVQSIILPGGIAVIEHGHEHDSYKPSHNDLRNAYPKARLIIYGHTHIQVIDKEDATTHVINPGAAGFTRNKGGASCIILTINNNLWDYKAYKFSN